MKVRLVVPEAFATEGTRVRRALEAAGIAVATVTAQVEGDLVLRTGESVLGVPPAPDAAVIGLPEPRDALVAVRSATLEEVPEGGAVGLSGALRREMLGVHRPDLRAVEIEDAGARSLYWMEDNNDCRQTTIFLNQHRIEEGRQSVGRSAVM